MKIIQTKQKYEENMGFGSSVNFGAINVQFGNVSIWSSRFLDTTFLPLEFKNGL
jgi:hypothetical protein